MQRYNSFSIQKHPLRSPYFCAHPDFFVRTASIAGLTFLTMAIATSSGEWVANNLLDRRNKWLSSDRSQILKVSIYVNRTALVTY
jgi:hypothetical protein